MKIITASLKTLLFVASILVGTAQARAGSETFAAVDKQLAGKDYKKAIRTLTQLMNSGNLSEEDMVAALYKRGVAFNGAERYAAAIADLSGVIWLGKLSAADQKDALRERAKAYKATDNDKYAARDIAEAGGSGTRSERAKPVADTSETFDLPDFTTTVKPASGADASATKAPSAHETAKEKEAVPAFRTSIVTE